MMVETIANSLYTVIEVLDRTSNSSDILMQGLCDQECWRIFMRPVHHD